MTDRGRREILLLPLPHRIHDVARRLSRDIHTSVVAIVSFTDVFAHIRQPVLSELDVFILEKAWFVKYRVTYPEACAASMSSRVAAFMAAFAWPDGA